MAEAEDQLLLNLHRIPSSTSEETLDMVIQTLWDTRKTGLGSTRRPEIQTLLALPTPQLLDPVVACIRLIIRRCVNEKLSGDEIQKLFPLDVSVDVRRIIVNVLQKRQNQWREEAAKDKLLWQRPREHIKVNAPYVLASFPNLEPLTSLWPRQDDATSYPKSSDVGPGSGFTDSRHPCTATLYPVHMDNNSPENMAVIPRLKSMTWTMENRGLSPANRVAIITLKLQDYTKSPSGEIEVKFQLSKDPLDAMLRSMAYISEQLSNTVVSHLEPSSKKQRQ